MKTPILENDDEENAAEEVGGIFTVNPECPIYQDPFYAEDETVIASFPMDHHCYDQVMLHHWLALIFFSAALLFTFYVSWGVFFVVVIHACIYLPIHLWGMYEILSTQHERRRTHVAIATTGIYLDKVRTPESRVVGHRQVFKYEEYQHCYLAEQMLSHDFTIMLKPRNSLNPPIVLVKGLLGTQSFADQVNHLIEQAVSSSTANSPSPIIQNEGEYSLRENTTMAVANGDSLKVDPPDGPFFTDPFYATDGSVLTTLSIDHSIGDRFIHRFWAVLLVCLIVFPVSTWLVEWAMDRYEYVERSMSYVSVASLFFLVLGNLSLSSVESLHTLQRCRHVAIARTGIYVDHVSAPGSRIHMCRIVHPYEDMQYCYVEKKASSCCWGDGKELVKIKRKNSGFSTDLRFEDLILEPQCIAEKVNAMIQQSAVHTMKSSNTATVV